MNTATTTYLRFPQARPQLTW